MLMGGHGLWEPQAMLLASIAKWSHDSRFVGCDGLGEKGKKKKKLGTETQQTDSSFSWGGRTHQTNFTFEDIE